MGLLAESVLNQNFSGNLETAAYFSVEPETREKVLLWEEIW